MSIVCNEKATLNPTYASNGSTCTRTSNHIGGGTYEGRGIAPKKHPMREQLPLLKASCKGCKSKNVRVIYASRALQEESAAPYYDFEVICDDCKKFTVYSQAAPEIKKEEE